MKLNFLHFDLLKVNLYFKCMGNHQDHVGKTFVVTGPSANFSKGRIRSMTLWGESLNLGMGSILLVY